MKLFYTLFLLLLIACNSSTSSESTITAQAAANADQVITNYGVHLIADPKTQPERDQNTIVGYAMDNALELKRSLSGMYYQIIEEGEGTAPSLSSKVSAHYEGQLLDGTVFDSSYKRNEPLNFSLRQVIKGWQEALQMLKPGGKGLFLIPSRLAYGKKGFGNSIPPDTVLLFKIELLEVEH